MTEKYPYGQFSPEHLEAARAGIELFNNGEYWECHEALEDPWYEDISDNARYIYWAIIQVAAALVHYENENITGCIGMLSKAKEKFKKAREKNAVTDVAEKYLSWSQLERLALAVPANAQLSDFDELYKFRFNEFK